MKLGKFSGVWESCKIISVIRYSGIKNSGILIFVVRGSIRMWR